MVAEDLCNNIHTQWNHLPI